MYQTVYEISDKLVLSTFFNALFYVLIVCTALAVLSWINFNKDKTFWKGVVVAFNVMVIALWIVHIVVVDDIKKQYVDAYKEGKYLVCAGSIENFETLEDGGSFVVSYNENDQKKTLSFIYPHPSNYGFKGEAELKKGDKVIISYVVDTSMDYNKNADLKCIVKIDKLVENAEEGDNIQ